jgi:hypothetical protein
MSERNKLPTPAQVAVMDDIDSLKALELDVEQQIIKIETDLEFDDGSKEEENWRNRAKSALSAHRFIYRQIKRRLSTLTAVNKGTGIRPPEECGKLTLELITKRTDLEVNPSGMNTIEEIERSVHWTMRCVAEITRDRDQELKTEPAERDDMFLTITSEILTNLRYLRQRLQNRQGDIARESKAKRAETREQLFIKAAKEVLTGAQYLDLWRAVDQKEAQLAAAEPA